MVLNREIQAMTSAELLELADQIDQAIHVKIQMSPSGSEILPKGIQTQVAIALRAAASLRALAELPPSV